MPDSGKPKQSAPSDFLYTHDNSDKRYLVQAVKLARSQGYVGSQGSWSAFVKASGKGVKADADLNDSQVLGVVDWPQRAEGTATP